MPEALTNRIGPLIGHAVGGDEPMHLPAADGYAGVALVGQPGSGKSIVIRNIWGWHCLERVEPAGLPRWPGRRNAMVAFESKGEDAAMWRSWARAAGDKTLVIDVAEPGSYGIDLFDLPGSTSERASWFTNALVYTFGETAIGDRSFDTLQSVLTAALAIDAELANSAGIDESSPLQYAYVLLGGLGDAHGQNLAAAIAQAAVTAEAAAAAEHRELGDGSDRLRRASTPLGVAAEALASLYSIGGSKVTDSQRRTLTDAPRNKLSQIISLDAWWNPSRRTITWDQVLKGHRSVVVNTGVSMRGRLVDERITSQMSSLLMYGLKSAIQRNCSGWQDEGRSVTVFADELSLVAGNSPEVVAWMRNQGRSYGVRAVFATQYPEQLDMKVRTAFMSFGTLIAFAQQNTEIAEKVAADLTLGDDEWSASDLKSLEPYHAIVRTSVAQHRQPATAAVMAFYEDRLRSDPEGALAEFRTDQGW